MPDQHTLLVAKNISKSFNLEERKIVVIDDISLEIMKGEFVAIMGKSGSGKSTLLSVLAGLDWPSSGTVFLNDENLTDMSEDQLSLKRQKDIGFVFQSFHLIPTLNVEENIAFPLNIRRQYDQEKIESLIEKVSLSHRKNSLPNQLLGGEKQRTAIARALISEPKILFADEPTGNLDVKNADSVMNLLIDLRTEFETALVIVTHDPEIAKLADRVITIENGELK